MLLKLVRNITIENGGLAPDCATQLSGKGFLLRLSHFNLLEICVLIGYVSRRLDTREMT